MESAFYLEFSSKFRGFRFLFAALTLGFILTPRSVLAACTAAANPPGCVTVKNVCASGGMDSTTIQGAVRLLPGNISASGNACVVIRDAATYAEQVNIPDVSMSSYTVGNNQIEILLDPSMSSGPVISPPASSAAGFKITQASVTIGGGILILPTNSMSYGIQASAPYATISSVNVVDPNGRITTAGIWISSNSTVSYSSVTVTTAVGMWISGNFTTLSYSTSTNNGAARCLRVEGSFNTVARSYAANFSASGDCALIDVGSYNTIRQSSFTNTSTTGGASLSVYSASNTVAQSYFGGGWVAMFVSGNYNTISLSTITGGERGLWLNGSTSNVVNATYMSLDSNGTKAAVLMDAGAAYNTINLSTITAANSTAYGLWLTGASSNVVTQTFMSHSFGIAARMDAGAAYNTISFSTMTEADTFGSVEALNISGASWNLVTQSYISNTAGPDAAALVSGAAYNTISWSTITTSCSSSGGAALSINNAGTSSNTVANSYLFSCPSNGWGLYVGYLHVGGNNNAISLSTITSNGGTGIYVGGALNAVTNCYAQGSVGTQVDGSTGTAINSSVLSGANTGNGLALTGGSSGLILSSTVITGGAQGTGVFLDKNNSGSIYLTTNTILAGSQYGIQIATQTSGTQIYATSNTIIPTITNANNTYGIYINGLQTGATIQNNQIYYRTSGTLGANTSYALYAQSAKGLNINHNRFNEPGQITAGSYVGVALTGTTNTLFKFNDLNASNNPANSLSQEYLLQLTNGSTGAQIKDNIFSSSLTVSGAGSSSATIVVDGASQSGFQSDYNDFYSYNSTNTAIWGATAYSLLAGWQGAPANQDAHSISSNPLWFNTSAGSEDFHPQSQTGRYNPATQSFATDCFTSATIDKGDPAEPFNLEPNPNGSLVNQGSYGNTPQASETFQVAPPASIGATALIGQVTVSWTSPNIPQSCQSYVDHYELSYSSVSSAGPFSTPPGGNPISSNTFVFLHTGLQSKTTYFYNVVTSDALLNKSVPAQTFAVTPDTIAPAAVANLAASQGSAVGQANLNWTFPGDDNGTTTLPAGSQYAVQYTTNNVTVIWSTANAQVTLSTANVPVNALQSTVLSGLNQTTTYYFRLWTNHPGPVWSAPSNIANSFSKQAGPSALSLAPTSGSSCVAVSTTITVNFNKTVQHGSFANAFNLTLVKDNLGNSTNTSVTGTLVPASDSSTYVFTPSASLIKNGTYAIFVSTLAMDLQNNPLAQSAGAQFVTAMDRTILNALTVPNLGVSITVPVGALSADGCLTSSTGTVSPSIGMANQKLQQNSGDPFRAPLSGSIVDLKIYDPSGNLQSGNFRSPVTISFPYTDANKAGVVDGTNPPVRTGTLGVWWLDETNALWVRLPSSSVDAVAKRVTADAPHFTTFALIGQATTDLSSAYAFPVPFKPSAGHTVITFTGLSQIATVRIYTVSGELVRELSTSDGSGQSVWDVKNSRGEQAATGIYLYRVFNGSAQVMGKLAIIR